MKEISLFVSSDDILDLTIELSQHTDIQTKVQSKSALKPNADKEHGAYHLSGEDWAVLIVSSIADSNLLRELATAIINFSKAIRKPLQIIVNSQLAISVSPRTREEEIEQKWSLQDVNTICILSSVQISKFYVENYHNQGDTIMPQGSKQQFNNNLPNAQIAGGLVNADKVEAGQIGGNINNYTPQQKQNLAEAAAEIQQLLQQLEQTNPTTTTSEKMTVVAKAVNEIESNPTLKARVIGALKLGGTEAIKELVDHPLVNILLASIEGWQEAE